MASPLAERSDIILSDLTTHLQGLDLNKVVMVVATECKTVLPCCQQSLGPRNSQVSKLWAAVHWKDTSCAAYWKDKHVLCIRKYRKNSAYAKEEEVLTVLQVQYPDIASRFLHKLQAKKTGSPNNQTRQPFGARRASSVTLNNVSVTHSSVITKTPESAKVALDGEDPSKDQVSPTQGRIVGVRPPLKARLSEPVLHSNASRPPARLSMVTRRQSSISLSKPASITSVDLKARVRPSASPTTHTASPPYAAVQGKRRASAAVSAAAKPVSVATRRIASASASYIPTPTKRSTAAAARRVQAASPETPTARKSLDVQLTVSPPALIAVKACKEMATQTEPEKQIDEPLPGNEVELASLTLCVQELEMENIRLGERVEASEAEILIVQAEKSRLEAELSGKDAIIKDLLEQLRAARPATRTNQEGRPSLNIERKVTRTAEVAAEGIPSAHKLQSMLYATPPRVRFQLDMLPIPCTPACSETYSTPMSIRSTPSHFSPARKIQSPLALSLKKGKGGFRLFRFLTKRRMSSR